MLFLQRSFSEFHTQRALSQQNLPIKLREWEAKLNHLLKLRAQLFGSTETRSDEYVTAGLESTVRLSPHEIDRYVQDVLHCQRQQQSHLKELIITRKGSDLSSVLPTGRAVLLWNSEKLPQPCVGIVVSAPKSSAAASGSGSGTASASGANSLLASLRSGTSDAAIKKAAEDGANSLGDEAIWVLVVLPPGCQPAPPSACDPSPVTVPASAPAPAAAPAKKKDNMFDFGGMGAGTVGKKGAAMSSVGSSKAESQSQSSSNISWTESSGIAWSRQGAEQGGEEKSGCCYYAIVRCTVKEIVLIFNKKVKAPTASQQQSHTQVADSAKQLLTIVSNSDHGIHGCMVAAGRHTLGLDSVGAVSGAAWSPLDLTKELGKNVDLDFADGQQHVQEAAAPVLSCT
jgi:hypothetical protein